MNLDQVQPERSQRGAALKIRLMSELKMSRRIIAESFRIAANPGASMNPQNTYRRMRRNSSLQ
jgi:hypothetical protein